MPIQCWLLCQALALLWKYCSVGGPEVLKYWGSTGQRDIRGNLPWSVQGLSWGAPGRHLIYCQQDLSAGN